jgi:6-pyruvoyltetrahydropterin/6-carboxytetrahydropterin synthase
MITLSREIRFALVPQATEFEPKPSNSWAGWPTSLNIVPRLKLLAQIEGDPDPVSGFVCNVAVLDDVLRAIVTEHLIPRWGDAPHRVSGPIMLTEVFRQFQNRWRSPERLVSLTLRISNQLSFTLTSENEDMLQLTQQFEFSAAHRLHCDSMTDQENKDMFGKCNNPNGHGHNYVFDVTVEQGATDVVDLQELQQLVKSSVVDRLDHKNLNEDIDYFQTVNPSVENISVVVFDWIKHSLNEADFGGNLIAVKVFETPKTWAEYRGYSKQ